MQEIQNLSPLNKTYININRNRQQQPQQLSKVNMSQKEDTFEVNGQVKSLSTTKKLAIGAVVAASITALAAIIIKKKNPSKAVEEVIEETAKVIEETKEIAIKKRNEVDIKKGIAHIDNKPFTGIVEDTVSGSNPFKYHLEYENGVLQKSIKTKGDDVLEKTYQTLEDGSQKITTKANGSISEKTFNKKELQKAISDSRKKYSDLKYDFNLSADEFNKKANEIQYLNKNQKADLAQIHSEKVANEQKEAAIIAQKEAQKASEQARVLEKIKSPKDLENMSVEELLDYQRQLAPEMAAMKNKNNQELYNQLNESYDKARLVISKKNSPEYAFSEILPKINTDRGAVIKNKATGEDISVKLNKTKSVHDCTYGISVLDSAGEVYGKAEVSQNCFSSFIPEGYAENSLYLTYLCGSPKSQGAGSELIKEVVMDSKKSGHDGKVWVRATGGHLPQEMSSLAGAEKMKTSPVPFYFKQGFRFADDNMNKAAQEGLENLKKGLSYNGPEGGDMYLPKEAIEKILNS